MNTDHGERAAVLLSVLEARGAIFRLTPAGDLFCDLNPCDFRGLDIPVPVLARMILGLERELTSILRMPVQ